MPTSVKGGFVAIDEETRSRIRRLFYVDHFAVNAIAEIMGVHHETVKNAINWQAFANKKKVTKGSLIEPYSALIDEKLRLYPKLTATRLMQLLQDRGYSGSINTLRRHLRKIRGHYKKVYMRMSVHPAEQGQVDWAHCGTLKVRGGERKLYAFVMVLSYSRAVYAEFCLNQKTATFLRCHERAFAYFGGIPRVILYDNLKSVVLARHGRQVRFHPDILDFSGFYHFEPRPCRPYGGNEKGRVERTIRYLRSSYLAGRDLHDLQSANESLRKWCDRIANRRPWPEGRRYSVKAMWEKEKPMLLGLQERSANPKEQESTIPRKTPWIRFDLNAYSIPPRAVGYPLVIAADDEHVEIHLNGETIARHRRSFDRSRFIEDPKHRKELLEHYTFGRTTLFKDAIIKDFPAAERIVSVLFKRGHDIATVVRHLYRLRYSHGDDLFEKGLSRLISEGRYSIESLRYILQKLEREMNTEPRVEITLPDNPAVRDLEIKPRLLSTYDQL